MGEPFSIQLYRADTEKIQITVSQDLLITSPKFLDVRLSSVKYLALTTEEKAVQDWVISGISFSDDSQSVKTL